MTTPFSGMRALVVDDYDNMRARLKAALEQLGVETVEAANGYEALDQLRAAPVDLVFTDIVMPEMDGFELCEEIRHQPEWNSLPIVVVSTHYDTKYIVRALRLGADDYVPKPIDKDLVERVIARVTTPLATRT